MANIGAANATLTGDTGVDVLTHYRVVGAFEFIFFLVGPPLQIAVLVLGTQLYREWSQKSQLIVLSMTFGDLMVSAIHSPLMFGFYGLDLQYSLWLCVVMYLATFIGCISSSLSLLLLNLDKFIYLNKPLHYTNLITTAKATIAIIICWLVAICWTILILFGPATRFVDDGECTIKTLSPGVYMCFVIVFLTLPTLASFSVSLYIRYLVNRTRNADLQMQQEMNHLTNSIGRQNSRRSQLGSHLVTNLRSIAFVFSATIWTCCTVLPYRITFIMKRLGLIANAPTTWIFMFYCFILLSMNPVGNPIVVITSQRIYKEHIRKRLSKYVGFTSGLRQATGNKSDRSSTQYSFT